MISALRHDRLRQAALALIGAAGLYAALLLVLRFAYEWQGPFTGDSPIYWAVGRGMLNGLQPYVDLFETKPPGMFVVSALSFWLTGDPRFAGWLQAIVILLTPFGLLAACWQVVTGDRARRFALLLALWLPIALLSLYNADRAGEFQTESFGNAFAALALAAIAAHDRSRLPAWRIGLAALGLFAAAGFKEPFALTFFAAALVLSPTPKSAIRVAVLPLIIAGAAGVLALFITGYADGYFGLYLPHMFAFNLERFGPAWVRSFAILTTMRDAWLFTSLLPAVIALLGFLALRWGMVPGPRSAVASAGFALCVTVAFTMITGLTVSQVGVPPWTWPLLVLSLLGAAWCVRSLTLPRSHGAALRVWHIGTVLFAIYASLYAVGMSGEFLGHHCLFALPVYGAFLVLAADVFARDDRALAPLCLVLAACAGLAIIALPSVDYAAKLEASRITAREEQARADEVDRILDACSIDRYLIAAGSVDQIYGFTRHSPMGPGFFQYTFNVHALPFAEALYANIQKASFILLHRDPLRPLPPKVQQRIDADFGSGAWPCAGQLKPLAGYELLFRRKPVP